MLGQRGRSTKFHQNPPHPNEQCSLKACSREVPISYSGRVTKIGFPWHSSVFTGGCCLRTFQTRQANRVSISRTLICDHFPPHSALCSLKSCNADLKLSQFILLHMATQPVKWGGRRWWDRSVVFHSLCQKVFCTKIINFLYPHPQFWISHTQRPQIYFCTWPSNVWTVPAHDERYQLDARILFIIINISTCRIQTYTQCTKLHTGSSGPQSQHLVLNTICSSIHTCTPEDGHLDDRNM